MKLHIGKMNNQELADWFNITKKAFTNNKRKKLEELRNYADFYEEKGKIIITHIKCEEYINNFKIVEEETLKLWDKENGDICQRIANEIDNNNLVNLNNNTISNYVRQVMHTYNLKSAVPQYSPQIQNLHTTGIYLLYYNDILLYIGSSNNIERRFKEHKNGILYGVNKKFYEYCAANNIKWEDLRKSIIMKGVDIDIIHSTEWELIREFKPLCNEAGM